MVKKLFLMLLCVLLACPCAVLAEGGVLDMMGLIGDAAQTQSAAGTQVIDRENVIPDAVEAQIAGIIQQIEDDHQVDIVVLVTSDVPTDYSDTLWRVERFADDFYDNGGYGMGPDFSGMLYLIDLHNRVQYISTGGVMMQYISDAREEGIFDAAEPYLRRDDWGRAALAAVDRTADYMARGRERGVFLYDRDTGKRLSGFYNPLEWFEVLLAAGGGLLTALIVSGTVNGSYNLKGGTYRYDLNGSSACTLTMDDEEFLRQTVTRTARSSGGGGHGGSGGGRSGGSGVHRSSSGRSHGGGGRRF